MFTLVTGGLRSGKSEYALARASELGPPPWLYVAPSIIGDPALGVAEFRSGLAELSDRIELTVREVTQIGTDLRIVARPNKRAR